jgi:hypothetical protein
MSLPAGATQKGMQGSRFGEEVDTPWLRLAGRGSSNYFKTEMIAVKTSGLHVQRSRGGFNRRAPGRSLLNGRKWHTFKRSCARG